MNRNSNKKKIKRNLSTKPLHQSRFLLENASRNFPIWESYKLYPPQKLSWLSDKADNTPNTQQTDKHQSHCQISYPEEEAISGNFKWILYQQGGWINSYCERILFGSLLICWRFIYWELLLGPKVGSCFDAKNIEINIKRRLYWFRKFAPHKT